MLNALLADYNSFPKDGAKLLHFYDPAKFLSLRK
jgi:hypothetical protein